MKNAMTAWETVKALCHAWFERCSVEETVSLLADEVCFVGTGENEFANSRQEMTAYLKRDIQELVEPFTVSLILFQEQEINPQTHNISVGMTLQNTQYKWQLRGFFTLVDIQGSWRFRTLWFSEPGLSQQGEEHYPSTLVVERLAKQRQDLLNDSMSGGMMGGYIEKGFPFYFVNKRMLDYLGYADEAEFVTDIEGMISNCIHPEDRNRTEIEVDLQIEARGEYVVEYRMKKQDGSYIWIHDLGRAVTAENGKPVILSVCIDITALKKAQSEILHLYNNVPGAVFRCRYDEGFSVTAANDGLYEFLGYTREEFFALGNRMAAVVYPSDLDIMREKLLAGYGGETIRDEQRIICKDGSIKWISLKAQLMQGDDGSDYFYGVFVDITDERLAQERVRELYEKELAYFAQAASADGSIQGRVNVTKDKLESRQAMTAVDVGRVGDTYVQIIEELERSAVDTSYGAYIRKTLDRAQVLVGFAAGKTEFHFEFLRRQGEGGAFWSKTTFRLHQNPESGDIIAFFYTFDVTVQKLQEQLLSKVTELDYELISDIDIRNDTYYTASAHSGIDKFMESKGQFQETVRKIAANYMDEKAGQVYISKLEFAYMRRKLAQQDSYRFIVETKDKNRIRVKRYRIFYISKELERVCIVRSDVTDIVRQEQQQKEALSAALAAAEQANAAKTDFLSRMSHEIRTPMNAIIGMTTIAAQSIGDDVRVADCISKIGLSSRFLLSLINDILDMSRIESGKMLLKNERISMEEFLNGLNAICYSQAAAKGVRYECRMDSAMDRYYMGDAMKLQQVLLNILSNAVKFTGEGGMVTLRTALYRRNKNSAVLRFVVTDNGIGINEAFLHHVFEPFEQESIDTTTQYGGTGLGLSISKNIVEMMGGRIAVRSAKGKGSEFTVFVRLGLVQGESGQGIEESFGFSGLKLLAAGDEAVVYECAAAMSKRRDEGSENTEYAKHTGGKESEECLGALAGKAGKPEEQAAVFDFHGRRILLVEDNAINTEVAVALLESEGFAVDTADNGLRALEAFSKSGAGFYDAILMDIRMPLMDGWTATNYIRHMSNVDAATIPIIAMTANAFDGDTEKSRAAGMNAHLTKPIEPKRLLRVLHECILGEREH